MGKSNCSEDFKRDAVHQTTVRGYPFQEASRRLGASTHCVYNTHCLCKWMKLFAVPVSKTASVGHEAEDRRQARAGAGHRGARHPEKGRLPVAKGTRNAEGAVNGFGSSLDVGREPKKSKGRIEAAAGHREDPPVDVA